MKVYEEKAQKIAKQVVSETRLKGDAFVDEFFNRLDPQTLLEFQHDETMYSLMISRSYLVIEDEINNHSPENFGANYLFEHRDIESNLLDISDFTLGEEDKLIHTLHKLGLGLNNVHS